MIVLAAALSMNGRFACGMAAKKIVLPRQVACRERTQHDFDTSALGSKCEFAARCTNGGFRLFKIPNIHLNVTIWSKHTFHDIIRHVQMVQKNTADT